MNISAAVLRIVAVCITLCSCLAFRYRIKPLVGGRTCSSRVTDRPTDTIVLSNKLMRDSEDINPKSSQWNYKKIAASSIVSVYGLLLLNTLKDRASAKASGYPVVGGDDIMSKKAHGTSGVPVQSKLRWNCDVALADRICNYNRNWAENAGYWSSQSVTFLKEIDEDSVRVNGPIKFYDSVTGALLFKAPVGRSFEDWRDESLSHGWPSFRDQEVNWDAVRALRNGETVSLTGTHLGHNLPDRSGNRYCINLVSIAGYPVEYASKCTCNDPTKCSCA